ncbi:MAG TPA: BON domain-containing protein [Candidatus Binataceae bacterium]|nr:BON domain-containing protein [Candidatus Binataceae bacterium]
MNRNSSSTIFARLSVAAFAIALALAIPRAARADASTVLMNRVQYALAANTNLNGASCYVVSPGVVVLYGTVFNDKDRDLAESTARGVRGVHKVVNTLRTSTGKWLEQESRINDTLLLNGFNSVQVRVIANQAYLSGTVSSPGEEQRAIRTVSSVSNLQVVNFMRVVPGSIF